MKRHALASILPVLLLVVSPLSAQLSLESCWEKARNNYPLIKQLGLLKQSEKYTLSNISTGYIPQLSFSAKATYQSDVTTMPDGLTNIIPGGIPGYSPMTKDQYQVAVQLDQTIWDGGLMAAQRKTTKAQTAAETASVEASLYAIRNDVCNLFLGILLMQEQLVQTTLIEENLRTQWAAVRSRVANGVAQSSDEDAVRVEMLKIKQQRQEIESQIRTSRQHLSLYINEKIDASVLLIRPTVEIPSLSAELKRPELQLYAMREAQYEAQQSSILAKNMPRIGLFLQAGYGKPGLNMLVGTDSPFALGGIRLSWTVGGLYTQANERRQIQINKQLVGVQREVFCHNIDLLKAQQNEAVMKYKQYLQDDDSIVALRLSIRKNAEARLENGTLSMSEYLREVNAEAQARQSLVLHQMQYLKAVYDLKLTLNQ